MTVWPSYLMINPSSSSSIPALLGTAHYNSSFIVMQLRISTPYANPKANAKAILEPWCHPPPVYVPSPLFIRFIYN